MTKDEALKLALEALERGETELRWKAINIVKEALAQHDSVQAKPEPEQKPVANRDAFERYWKKTRGEKKSDRELKRHPLQPQTYVQDSANRHWVTWQAAVRSVSPPQRKPLTDEQIWDAYMKAPVDIDCHVSDLHKFARAIETAHGIKE